MAREITQSLNSIAWVSSITCLVSNMDVYPRAVHFLGDVSGDQTTLSTDEVDGKVDGKPNSAEQKYRAETRVRGRMRG